MLVIKRNNQEKIQIGNDITIIVLESYNGCVKLGIEAPKEIAITRPDAVKQKPKDIAT